MTISVEGSSVKRRPLRQYDKPVRRMAFTIASYFNFVNRVAEGLDVEFSAEEVRGYQY